MQLAMAMVIPMMKAGNLGCLLERYLALSSMALLQ
jgi:hypothetical protein